MYLNIAPSRPQAPRIPAACSLYVMFILLLLCRIALSANQAEMARLASAVVGEQRVREESEVTMSVKRACIRTIDLMSVDCVVAGCA